MPSRKILVVDDEPDLLSLLQEWLEEAGHEVYAATNGWEALELFSQQRPALTITDLRMPGMDGFQLISRIREMSGAHVLALTALSGEEHTIRGLELGADEYLVKPIRKRVFLARVGSLLRRAVPVDDAPHPHYTGGCLTISFPTHQVQVRGQPLHLRPTEFRLLAYLIQNQDRVVGHQELLDRVWGVQFGSLASLKWYILSLREKVEENPREPRLIVTIPRVGYRYLVPETHHHSQKG